MCIFFYAGEGHATKAQRDTQHLPLSKGECPKGEGVKTSSPAHLLGGEGSNFLLSSLRRRESDLTQEHRMN